MSVIGWKIWYGNETVISSKESTWKDCPEDDVQLVVIYYSRQDGQGRPTRDILRSADYYFHVPDTELFGDNNDSPEITKERYPNAIIKRGKWTSSEILDNIRKKVLEDYDI